MEVTDEFFSKLKNLQEILVEKYEIEAKIAENPKQLVAQKELLARLKKEYIAKNTEYDEIKEKVSKIKFELDEAVKSREAGEQGMDNISTHREYEALEKQVNEAKIREADLRKDLQKEEKILAELKDNMKISEDMIAAQEKEVSDGEASSEKQLASYNAKLDELKSKEEDITPDFDQEILFKFQRIIQRNSEGIVSVKNNVCNGCNMILPSQFVNIVREGKTINFCPYCSRILYYEESEEGDSESYFRLEDSGSLADLYDEYDEEEKDEDYYGDDETAEDEDSEKDDDEDDSDDADDSNESDED